jgi:hypothetical protein
MMEAWVVDAALHVDEAELVVVLGEAALPRPPNTTRLWAVAQAAFGAQNYVCIRKIKSPGVRHLSQESGARRRLSSRASAAVPLQSGRNRREFPPLA